MKLETRYYWKELSDDGLLEEPRDYFEDHYPEHLNGSWYVGFESENQALAALEEVVKKNPFLYGELILVKTYRFVEE